MDKLIYFLISVSATTAGAMTGMGGGVIIKPVLDLMGQYDVATIGMLSSITVFTMAIVSVLRQLKNKVPIRLDLALALAFGSILGGIAGQQALSCVLEGLGNNTLVSMLQNIMLALLIIGVFFYMSVRQHAHTLEQDHAWAALIVGLILGIISSFLGIGGGPINVALLIYVLSLPTKTATVYSIIAILAAQVSKLGSVALTMGFAQYDLSMLPMMIVGAVLGGLIGSQLNKKLPERAVEQCFNVMQFIVFGICVVNIVRALLPVS